MQQRLWQESSCKLPAFVKEMIVFNMFYVVRTLNFNILVLYARAYPERALT